MVLFSEVPRACRGRNPGSYLSRSKEFCPHQVRRGGPKSNDWEKPNEAIYNVSFPTHRTRDGNARHVKRPVRH